MKKYLKLTCLFITTIFVLNLFGACEIKKPSDVIRMWDNNGIFYCQYIDETHTGCAVGSLVDQSFTDETYVFFPAHINNVPVVQIGFDTITLPFASLGDINTVKMFVPYTVKIIYFGSTISHHVVNTQVENIKHGATIPTEYYEFYTQKFPDATFRKANIVYYLNYENEPTKYYCVDHEFYTIGENTAKWINDNTEFEYSHILNNICTEIICTIQDVVYRTTYEYDWIRNESGYLTYQSKIKAIPPAPEREGYTFAGWFKEAECINEWDFEKDTLPEFKLDENDNVIFQETALYAKWVQN